MRARVLPYRPGDADALDLCVQQRSDFDNPVMTEVVDLLASHGRAFTLRDKAGRVLMIAGVAQIDPGYGHCWAFQSSFSGPHMPWITRRVQHYLGTIMASHRRLEMMVRADFEAAIRWAQLLGFSEEGLMPKAAPDGGAMLRYGRTT